MYGKFGKDAKKKEKKKKHDKMEKVEIMKKVYLKQRTLNSEYKIKYCLLKAECKI